jgi:hypothetical protein
MSLDKAIKYGKERLKEYYGSKAYDSSCRNHADAASVKLSDLFEVEDKMKYYCGF